MNSNELYVLSVPTTTTSNKHIVPYGLLKNDTHSAINALDTTFTSISLMVIISRSTAIYFLAFSKKKKKTNNIVILYQSLVYFAHIIRYLRVEKNSLCLYCIPFITIYYL